MPEVVRENVKIHYETFGNKDASECILFLSGAGSDGTIWRHQIPALQDSFYLITVDNRGSGKSDVPSYSYDVDMMAADVDAILAHEEVDSVNLVGFSLGGLIAQRVINNHPSKVKRLVLMNCSLGAGNANTVLPKREVINMFLFVSALTEEDCCKNAMDYNFGESFEQTEPALYAQYYKETMANYYGISHQIPILVSDKALIDDYSSITVPVLYVLSNDDPVTPPENGEGLLKEIPHAKVEYLDGYHASMLIHPQEVSKMLSAFITST